jgi:4-hydroxy-tetrahydrodipicolinate synthase
VTLPYYSKPGQKGIVDHFERLAAETGLPLLVENAPARTASDLTIETLGRLAAIPAISAIVDASGDISRLANLAPTLRQRFRFLSGHDATALAFACSGGSGCISAAANVLPRLFTSLLQAAQGGNLAAATSLHDRLLPLIQALGAEGDPARIKHALHRLRGLSAELRLPLVEAEADIRSAIDDALVAFRGSGIERRQLSL